jgi:hypothetical protein
MKENIICSGALFYATSTKRFLFLQRTDEKSIPDIVGVLLNVGQKIYTVV